MLKVNIKQLFLFIFVGLIAMSCDDDNLMGPEHTDADGMILELDGDEVYRELDGEVLVNNLSLTVNSTLELSVHFLDQDGEEIEHEEDGHEEEDELTFTGYDNTVISLEVEEHCDEITDQTECESSDHCEWHADESACEDGEHHELGFELTGLSAGSTSFSVSLMHDDHADYVSLLIPITVSNE